MAALVVIPTKTVLVECMHTRHMGVNQKKYAHFSADNLSFSIFFLMKDHTWTIN